MVRSPDSYSHDTYTLDYFVEKFGAIPADQWTAEADYDAYGRRDVWGHVNGYADGPNEEADELYRIAYAFGWLSEVCAGTDEDHYWGKSPKARVLRFLEHVRNNRVPFLHA